MSGFLFTGKSKKVDWPRHILTDGVHHLDALLQQPHQAITPAWVETTLIPLLQADSNGSVLVCFLQQLDFVLRRPNATVLWDTLIWELSAEQQQALLNSLPMLTPQQWQVILPWLGRLDWSEAVCRSALVDLLMQEVFSTVECHAKLFPLLKQLDHYSHDVTAWGLSRFPTPSAWHNHKLIQLLCELERPAVVTPLTQYVSENPTYQKTLIKACAKLPVDWSAVNDYYLNVLQQDWRELSSGAFLELVRQIRRRGLKAATVDLMSAFPYDPINPVPELMQRTIHGEIAITLAEFGCYAWGRDVLLADIVSNGISRRSLKAIEILRLQEAVPLLKAIFLLPESPRLKPLQAQAYAICKQLLKPAG